MNQSHISLLNVSMNRSVDNKNDHDKQKRVLDSISLSIETGERVALIGDNGAGKSTLLRLIAGIYKPDEGSIERTGDFSLFLDAGFGVDMRLTGRENCYSRAIINGNSFNGFLIFQNLVNILINQFVHIPLEW